MNAQITGENNWDKSRWREYLDEPLRGLAVESFKLIQILKNEGERDLEDFGFVVFPIAKAYEGFLKKLLWDMKVINRQQYASEHFRIGRGLNPNLPKRYQSGWVYAKLARRCGGEELPARLWETWKKCRNRVFHYFPDSSQSLSLREAEAVVYEVAQTMEWALVGCGLDRKGLGESV